MKFDILEPKPFLPMPESDNVHLQQIDPCQAQNAWQYIQRDHQLGGKNYAWIESHEDIAKYITSVPNPDSN